MRISVTNRNITVSSTPGATRVVRAPQTMRVVTQGGRGPKGDAGDADSMQRILRPLVAAAAISALRALRTNSVGRALYADAATLADAGACIGISYTAAAASGASLQAVTQGLLTDSGWAWIPGAPVYLGLNGALTQTPPAAPACAFAQVLAVADSATSLIVNIHQPVTLA